MSGAYGPDLAWIHHVGFTGFARAAAPGIVALLKRAVPRRRVIDLGCGSGVLSDRLARAGHEVIGVDASRGMVSLARRTYPGVRFVRASFVDFEFPACDAIVSVGECLNYATDRRTGSGGLAPLFRRAHGALSPGGLLVFDLIAPARPSSLRPERRWMEGEGWAVLVQTDVRAGGRALTRRIVSFRKAGRGFRRSEELHRLRLPGPGECAAALRRSGFSVKRAAGYGRFRFERRDHIAFIATKRRVPGI